MLRPVLAADEYTCMMCLFICVPTSAEPVLNACSYPRHLQATMRGATTRMVSTSLGPRMWRRLWLEVPLPQRRAAAAPRRQVPVGQRQVGGHVLSPRHPSQRRCLGNYSGMAAFRAAW